LKAEWLSLKAEKHRARASLPSLRAEQLKMKAEPLSLRAEILSLRAEQLKMKAEWLSFKAESLKACNFWASVSDTAVTFAANNNCLFFSELSCVCVCVRQQGFWGFAVKI